MLYMEKVQFIRKELGKFQQKQQLDTYSMPLDVETALKYITDHLFEARLNVSTLQEACNLRNNNLSGRFRRYTGLSLYEYILGKRLEAAMHLLTFGKIEIYLIAAAVGYTHHESFSRAFKRWVGCSPSEYRAKFNRRSRQAKTQHGRASREIVRPRPRTPRRVK